MKKVFVILLMTVLLTMAVYFYMNSNDGKLANLVNPGFNSSGTSAQKSEPEPSASPNMKAPKSFNFDASTDLKAELEKVNPEVLDSDFE